MLPQCITKIKGIIEGGPPDTIPAQFEKYVGAKEVNTVIAAEHGHRAYDEIDSLNLIRTLFQPFHLI